MIMNFEKSNKSWGVTTPMIIFQGMQVIVRINQDDNTITIKPIGGDREDIILIRYNDISDAQADFKKINIALCYDKAQHPEMFL